DQLCFCALRFQNGIVIPDRDDALPANGNSLGDAGFAVHREDLAVMDDEIGGNWVVVGDEGFFQEGQSRKYEEEKKARFHGKPSFRPAAATAAEGPYRLVEITSPRRQRRQA